MAEIQSGEQFLREWSVLELRIDFKFVENDHDISAAEVVASVVVEVALAIEESTFLEIARASITAGFQKAITDAQACCADRYADANSITNAVFSFPVADEHAAICPFAGPSLR